MDPREEAARRGAQAMLGAGKDAARRLYEDLVLTDEEKAKREAAREAAARGKRRKWLAMGVGGLVALIAVFVLLTKFLPWVIAFGLLAAAGYYFYRKARGSLRARREARAAGVTAPAKRAVAAEEPRLRVDAAPDPAARQRAEVARRQAEAARSVEREREIDEELAALKRKVRE